MSQTLLLLSVSRASWGVPTNHGTELDRHPPMKAIRDKILARDKDTCQGCGWTSARWQDIHHRDDDHSNFSESNLETLCPLCHQVFHLRQAGATNGGSIIWLPEISQADLNLMCFSLFVAMKTPRGPWAGIARTLFSILEARKSVMESQIGRTDPGSMAEMMLKLSPEEYANRGKMVGHLRLLPYASRFSAAIDYWEGAMFNDPAPAQWDKLLPDNIKLADLTATHARD